MDPTPARPHPPALPPPEFLPCPGDVLLLRSASRGPGLGLLARQGNLAVQGLMRGAPRARFTHVAVVLNARQIADALPGRGVRLRAWEAAAPGYDLDASWVARHRGLATDPRAGERVLRAYQRLHRQPYHLLRALRAAPAGRHDQATVCSAFVSDLLRLSGVPGPRPGRTAVLPVDIDQFTRRHPAWQRMPMRAHGLHAPFQDLRRGGPTPAELAAAESHVLALAEAVLGPMSADDRLDARRRAGQWMRDLDAALATRGPAGAREMIGRLDALTRHDQASLDGLLQPVLDGLEQRLDRQARTRADLAALEAQIEQMAQSSRALLEALRAASGHL